jgi:uncharacterized membrane protein
MVFGLMCFCFLDDVLEDVRKIGRTIIIFAVSTAFVFVLAYFMGVLHSSAGATGGGLGYFSANINQIINTYAVYANFGSEYAAFGRILSELPHHSRGQSEGNAYIGFGMIIFAFVALFAFVENFGYYKSKLSEKRTLRRTILTVVMLFIFYVVALSPVVTLGTEVILDYSGILPRLVERAWSVFRATGRYLWPIVYIAMVAFIWVAVKSFKKTTVAIIVVCLLFVQAYDMSGYFYHKGELYRNEQVWETNMTSEMWDIISRDYDHFFYITVTMNMYPVLRFAAENRMTVNDTYLARRDAVSIDTLKVQTWQDLHDGKAADDTVYIFRTVDEIVPLVEDNLLYVYVFDDMIAGFATEVENAESIEGVILLTPEMFVP